MTVLSRFTPDTDDLTAYAHLQAIERTLDGPRLPRDPLARLIAATVPPEAPGSPRQALYRTHAVRRRLLARRLRDAAAIPALARHLRAMLAAVPVPSLTQRPLPGPPQRSRFTHG